ncbi:MAG: PIN domain-containing protein [Thermoguttaceae bacterium]
MRVLDADTLTHLYAGHERVIGCLRRCEDPDVAIAVVTKAEILRARCDALLKAADAEQLLRAQSRFLQTERLLNELRTVAFDERATTEFLRLRARTALRKIGHIDLLLAALALANRATLVTRNLRHFNQVPNLNLENWVD